MTEASKIILMAASGFKRMADGSPRITLDGLEGDFLDAAKLSQMGGISIGVFAYVDASTAPADPEPAKGGVCAKWVAMRCDDETFQVWMFETYSDLMMLLPHMPPKEGVEIMVRFLCCVQSRAEIDNSDRAQQLFQSRIRGPWAKHTAE